MNLDRAYRRSLVGVVLLRLGLVDHLIHLEEVPSLFYGSRPKGLDSKSLYSENKKWKAEWNVDMPSQGMNLRMNVIYMKGSRD